MWLTLSVMLQECATPSLCGPISSLSLCRTWHPKTLEKQPIRCTKHFGSVTRAMEPNVAPATNSLASAGSKLTVKLKINVLIAFPAGV